MVQKYVRVKISLHIFYLEIIYTLFYTFISYSVHTLFSSLTIITANITEQPGSEESHDSPVENPVQLNIKIKNPTALFMAVKYS